MTQDYENPLDPLLALTCTIDDQQVYTYYLRVQVTDRCINRTTETLDEDLSSQEENTVNLVVTYELRPKGATCTDQKILVPITGNPDGLPGSITVLISEYEPPKPNGPYSPQADGKSIIRFEKASRK